MPVELVVPSVGESITEVEIGDWLKKQGETVDQDEPVVVIETDKVSVELPAPASGTITKLLKQTGEKASVGDVIGYINPSPSGRVGEGRKAPAPVVETVPDPPARGNSDRTRGRDRPHDAHPANGSRSVWSRPRTRRLC